MSSVSTLLSHSPTLARVADQGIAWANSALDKKHRLKAGIGAGTLSVAIYLVLVRYLRYRKINKLKKKYPDPTLAFRDPGVAEEVFHLTARYEFPFLFRTSLELALFKTYSVPSISKILYATGEFGKDTAKRAEDTGLILGETLDAFAHLERMRQKNPKLTQEEIDEQRQRPIQAITRLNEIHSKYAILNGDYLYTLSLFIIQPIKWIDKYGYRKLEPIEKNAIFRVWYDIGTRMNIKDIPTTLEAMFEFHDNYARDNVKYAPTNWKVGKPTVDHLLTLYPKLAAPIAFGIIPAVLDPIDVKGFGLNPPTPLTSKLVTTALRINGYIIRHFKLPRFSFVMRIPIKADPKTNLYKPLFDIYKPVYPDGYCIFELGPEKYKPARCPVMH